MNLTLREKMLIDYLEKNKNIWWSSLNLNFKYWKYSKKDEDLIYIDIVCPPITIERNYAFNFDTLKMSENERINDLSLQINSLQQFLCSKFNQDPLNGSVVQQYTQYQYPNQNNFNQNNFNQNNFNQTYPYFSTDMFDVIFNSRECDDKQINEINGIISNKAIQVLKELP